jgi:hypothetical protein
MFSTEGSSYGLPNGFYGGRFIHTTLVPTSEAQQRIERLELQRQMSLRQVVGAPGTLPGQLTGPGVVTGGSNVSSIFTSMRTQFIASKKLNFDLNFDTSTSQGTGFIGNSKNDQIMLGSQYKLSPSVNLFGQLASQRVLFLDQGNGTVSSWFDLGAFIGTQNSLNGSLSFQRIDTLSSVPLSFGAGTTSLSNRVASTLSGLTANIGYPIARNMSIVAHFRTSSSVGGDQPTIRRRDMGIGLDFGLLRNLRGGLTYNRLRAGSNDINNRYSTSLFETELRLEF